ncbi:MAG: hypothetical protein SynsKO_08440 [Synoicihabitans sp.]
MAASFFGVDINAQTLAGTKIQNQSYAAFEWLGRTYTVTSNLVINPVLPVHGLVIKPDGTVTQPGLVASVSPGTRAYLPYRLVNTGNITDDFSLSLLFVDEGSTFAPGDRRLFLDRNGNGVLDPGEGNSSINSVSDIPPGGVVFLIAQVDVPPNAPYGSQAHFDLQGQSVGDSTKTDTLNIGRIVVSDEASLQLRKSADRQAAFPGDEVYYTLQVLHVAGFAANGDIIEVDGAPRRGILVSDPIPEFSIQGTEYIPNSLVTDSAGAEPIYSQDGGVTWQSLSNLGQEPAPELISDVGMLFPAPFAPGQSVSATFGIKIAEDHQPGQIGNQADLRYRDSRDFPQTDRSTNAVVITILPPSARVYIGPANEPRARGLVDDNDDSTSDPGVDLTTNDPFQVVGNFVFFRNTIENGSVTPGVINVEVEPNPNDGAAVSSSLPFAARNEPSLPQTTVPSNWPVQLLTADGGSTLLDTNGDGIADVGELPPGGMRDVVVRVLIPSTFVPDENDSNGWQVVLRVSAANQPELFNLTVDQIPRVRLVTEFWSRFSKDVDAPENVAPGTPLTYTNRFAHDGNFTVTNAVILDNLDPGLTNVRDITSGSLQSLDTPDTVQVQATYDPGAHRIAWLIPVVPPGFFGELKFTADVAEGVEPGTEVPNEFVIVSDQTTAIRLSNKVDTVTGAASIFTIDKQVNREDVEIGDPVVYTVTVGNAGPTSEIQDIELVDTLPEGFRYLEGTAMVNDVALEPEVGADGVTLTWPLDQLVVGEQHTITYTTVVTPAVKGVEARNVVAATGRFPGGSYARVQAVATVRIIPGVFDNFSVIIGRVFVDDDRNGRFDSGETGVEGARLLLDDGVTVVTDRDGLYHVDGVKSGLRSIRLDSANLPDGTIPGVIETEHAFNPWSRFMDLKWGTLHRANFALQPPEGRMAMAEDFAEASGQVLPPELLAENGTTKVRVKWTGDTTPRYEVDLANSTIQVLFPGVIDNAAAPMAILPDVNIERIRSLVDEERKFTQLELRLRKRTSGYPENFVTFAEDSAPGMLEIIVGGEDVRDNDVAAAQTAAAEIATYDEDSSLDVLEELIGPVIHEPADGAVYSGRDKITVRVSAHLAAGFDLYVGEELVAKDLIGEKSIHIKDRRTFYEYVSVPLEPGVNVMRFESKGPSAAETGSTEITVLRAATPKKIEIKPVGGELVADGITEPVVAVVLRDENGAATGEASVISVEIDSGEILSPDFRPLEPGYQVQIRDGRALLRLSPATSAETREMSVRFGDIVRRERIKLRPSLRDWIVVGTANSSTSLNDIREVDGTKSDDVTTDADIHIFAQGRITEDTQLTVSYDSQREYDDQPIFRQYQADDFYPVYGDTSTIFAEAPSRDKLYAKVEREQSYVMYGDMDTEMNETDLAGTSRRLTGGKADIQTDYADFKGYVSHTEQAVVREEIPGGGISFYQLEQQGIISGSEEIYLETRDRVRPEEVLEQQTLSRGRDYSIDYSFGRILFKRPIPSRDAEFNPIVIVIFYEKDGRLGDKQYVYGGRASVHDKNRRFTLGVSHLATQNEIQTDTVDAVDFTVKVTDEIYLRGEMARSNTFENGEGEAHLIELVREGPDYNYSIYHKDVGEFFDNPGLRGTPVGREVTGVEITKKISENWGVRGEAYRQLDFRSLRQQRAGYVDLVHEGDGKTYFLGGGYVWQEEPNDDATATELSSSPLARIGGSVPLGAKTSIEGEYQHAFGDQDTELPTRGLATVSYQLFDNTRISLGAERRSIPNEGFETNLIGGTEVMVNENITTFNRYTMENGTRGSAGRANTGIDVRYPLSEDLRVDFTGEINQTVTEAGTVGTSRDFWSVATGFENTPSGEDYTLVGRHEYREEGDRSQHFNELGGTRKVGANHTLFARNRLTYAKSAGEDGDSQEWIAQALMGWAMRPLFNDRLHVISDIEFNYQNNSSALSPGRIHDLTLASEFNYQLASAWILEGKYAARAAWSDDAPNAVYTDLKAIRFRYDLTRRFYTAAGVRWLSQYETNVDTLGWGVEFGAVVIQDLTLALGYNFAGVEDFAFGRGENWTQGTYIAFRLKFDESLFGILRQLRGRNHANKEEDPVLIP